MGLEAEKDPWRELTDMAASFGYRLYYDRQGLLVLGLIPTPSPATAVPLGGALTVAGAFDHRPPNVIVARGETSDGVAVQAVAMDTNPASPTYAGENPGESPYGRKTEYFASPLLTSFAEASGAAASILAKNVAQPATWRVSKPYEPQVDPDDVLQVPITSEVSLPLAVDAVTLNIGGSTAISARAI
jgi:hypothetical protein